jgi:hypothetical protein
VIVPTADGTIDKHVNSDLPVLDPIQCGPQISMSWPTTSSFSVREFLVPLELRGAEAIGRCGEHVLATRHRYGQGVVYYFGTYVGVGLDRCDAEANAVIQRILLNHATPVIRGGRLRPRLIRGRERSLLVVFNDDRSETITDTLVLPSGVSEAIDIDCGSVYKATKGQIDVTVDAENCVVLLLR